jgi:acyl-lipid omega-6 desaturase (Delta-12 desaturase)
VSSTDSITQQKRTMIGRYTNSSNVKGLIQLLTTLAPIVILWWAAIAGAKVSFWLIAAAIPLLSLFILRAFTLMHECGHRSLFRSRTLNRAIGFLLGVVSGMPQFVWSQHHEYHHTHNGNWEKYRGPYTTLSTDEYSALSDMQQRMYRGKCSIASAPFTGFIYLLFNPRFTWLVGSVGLLIHVVRGKAARPSSSLQHLLATYKTRYWKSPREYWHMSGNNVVLLSIFIFMCSTFGTALFFSIYVISVSIAGGAGIILFTVQHNFEHAYASDTEHWHYDVGATAGTSFLVLPRWLNWFTLDIGYHHIHHLSSRIPNYRLAECHREYQHLFSEVTRIKFSQVYSSLKCILWDVRSQRIISVAEFRQQICRVT